MPDEDIKIDVENQDSSGSPPVPPAPPEPQPVPEPQQPESAPQPVPSQQPAPPAPQPEQTIRPEQTVEAESVMEVPPQEPQEEIPVPGRPMTDQTPPPPPKVPVVEKSGSFLKVLFGIVAFLALIGGGIWAYLNFVVAPATESNVEVNIPPVVTTPQSTMSVFSIDKDLDEFENELADLEKELETEFDLNIEIPDF